MCKARDVIGRVVKPVGKPMDLMRLELTTMSFAGICSTTELPVHIGQVGSDSCHMVELEVSSSPFIHFCQLQVIELLF